jgi:hypothetical protein
VPIGKAPSTASVLENVSTSIHTCQHEVLLVIATKAILIFILFLDVKLRGWHCENWYTGSIQVLCDEKSSQILYSTKDGHCSVMMYCNPRRIDS